MRRAKAQAGAEARKPAALSPSHSHSSHCASYTASAQNTQTSSPTRSHFKQFGQFKLALASTPPLAHHLRHLVSWSHSSSSSPSSHTSFHKPLTKYTEMSSNDKAEVAVEKANDNDKASGEPKAEKGAKRAAEEKVADAKKARTDGEENGEEEDVEDEEDVEGEEEEEEEDIAGEEEEDEEGEGEGEDDDEDA